MHGKFRWWDVRAQAGEGEGGGGTGTVEPAAAREFLNAWAPSPEVVTGLPDDQVMAWHGSVTKNLTAASQKAIEGYDWRANIAGDNPDAKKTLERFASPKALYESYDQFRQKLSKGEMRTVEAFPEKGTDEQKATWRQQNGVPPDGKYELKLPQGLKITEEDQPLVEGFTKFAHEQNMPASEVNKAATWFFGERAKRQEEVATQTKQKELETAAELGQEWGGDYKGNLNRINGVIDATLPGADAETKEAIGNAVKRNPNFARMMAAIALQMNPAGTLVPGDRGANEATIVDGIKKIEAARAKDRKSYDRDESQQAEYRTLLDAYAKTTGKNWRG